MITNRCAYSHARGLITLSLHTAAQCAAESVRRQSACVRFQGCRTCWQCARRDERPGTTATCLSAHGQVCKRLWSISRRARRKRAAVPSSGLVTAANPRAAPCQVLRLSPRLLRGSCGRYLRQFVPIYRPMWRHVCFTRLRAVQSAVCTRRVCRVLVVKVDTVWRQDFLQWRSRAVIFDDDSVVSQGTPQTSIPGLQSYETVARLFL